VFSSRGPEGARAIGDVAQFVVHDINNLLAVIASGLGLLECQSDAAYRKAIVSKMQHAITRGALLSRQLLDAARPCPESIGGFVAGSRLAALAGTLDQALRPDITVRTDIAPDLWDFDADPEELYFALLNLCRNSADAMPGGGAITVAARNCCRPPPDVKRNNAGRSLPLHGASPRSAYPQRCYRPRSYAHRAGNRAINLRRCDRDPD